MWRKFIGWGIPLLIAGLIVAIVAGSRTFSVSFSGDFSASGAAAIFSLIGWLVAIVGGMLLNAGLIGAAVGADPKTKAMARAANTAWPAEQRPASGEWAPYQTGGASASGPGGFDRMDDSAIVLIDAKDSATETFGAVAAPAPSGRVCPGCGAVVTAQDRFCGGCGKRFD